MKKIFLIAIMMLLLTACGNSTNSLDDLAENYTPTATYDDYYIEDVTPQLQETSREMIKNYITVYYFSGENIVDIAYIMEFQSDVSEISKGFLIAGLRDLGETKDEEGDIITAQATGFDLTSATKSDIVGKEDSE